MKKLVPIILLTLLVNIFSLSAQSISASGELSGCNGVSGKYVIPDNVTSIADFAFFQSDVSEVVIPAGVKSIGKLAFAYCYKLNKVEFQKGSQLSLIDEDAFSECTALSSISLPNGLKKIGARAFWLNSALTEVQLPESLEALPPYCFQSCTEITEISLPKGLKVIGENAFAGCRSLLEVEMNGVDSIATKAFYGCRLLRSFDLPETLRSIADSAFMKCELLTSITLPKSVQVVGDKLFRGCTKLKKIEVALGNPNFKSIDGILYSKDETIVYECPYTFASEKYVLPKTVRVIRPYAFFDCPKVQGISIPQEIEKIGLCALTNNGISEFDFAGNKKYPVLQGGIYYETMIEGVPALVAMAYPSLKSGKCQVPDHTILLAQGSFYGCKEMTEIVLPASLQMIDTLAMAYTTGMKDISCYAVKPPLTMSDCFLGVDQSQVTAHVLSGSLYQYTTQGSWKYFVYGEDVANQSILSETESPEIRALGKRGEYVVVFPTDCEYEVYDTMGNRLQGGKAQAQSPVYIPKSCTAKVLRVMGLSREAQTYKLL